MERKKIARRIAQIQERFGLNGAQFAESLGTSPSYVSDMKLRASKPSLEVLERLASEFKVDLEWLLTGDGDMVRIDGDGRGGRERLAWLPVVGEVPCGVPVTSFTDDRHAERVAVAGAPRDRDAFVLVARGESMLPRIEPGDKLVCVPAEMQEIRDGDIVVVSFHAGVGASESNCKVIRLYDRTRVVLQPLNPEYDAQEFSLKEIYKIYKVKQLIREVR